MRDAHPTTAVAEDEATVRWGLGDAAVGWLVAQVGGLISVGIVAAFNGGSEAVDDLSLSWIALAQLGLWLGLLGVPLWASRYKGNGMVSDYGLEVRARDVPVGVGWGLLTQLVLVPLVYLPIYLIGDIDSDELAEPARNLTDRATDPVGIVLLVLIVGIGAPIIEEIFYRGLVQRSLIRRLGTRPGVALTAVVFGFAHFQLLQLPALILFGVVVGVLAVRTGRLGPGIAAHMAFNMVTVVILVAQGS